MIVYYEEFDDLTDVVISSDGMSTRPNWKNKNETAIMSLLLSLFKQVELKDRSMSDVTKVWTFLNGRGKLIVTHLESMMTQGLLPGVEFKKIQDLEEKAKTSSLGRIAAGEKAKKYNAEDFFYSSPIGDSSIPKNELVTRISLLLEIGEIDLVNADDLTLKKTYRKAALKLHPDRNNGDGSKMSELNMLWNIYMGG
jgi:hypothetical protein